MLARVLIIVLLLASFPAAAVSTCFTHNEITGILKQQHQENRVLYGTTEQGRVIEIYMSKRRTFTIVITHPKQHCFSPPACSCMVMAGEDIDVDSHGMRVLLNGYI